WALPAATIGTTVVTTPIAPNAHPEHAAASAITITMDAILRATKLLTFSLFRFSLFTGSRLARDHHRGGERRAWQRLVADIDEAGVAEPSGDFFKSIIAPARGQQQVEGENRARPGLGKVGIHDVILDDHHAARFERAKALAEK